MRIQGSSIRKKRKNNFPEELAYRPALSSREAVHIPPTFFVPSARVTIGYERVQQYSESKKDHLRYVQE